MIEPKVVVAITAFNAQQFIAGCLSSLENQDYKNLEIYVVDNNLTDDTLNIIQKFNGVRLIKNKKNNGVCSVRNKIIKRSIFDLNNMLWKKINIKKSEKS